MAQQTQSDRASSPVIGVALLLGATVVLTVAITPLIQTAPEQAEHYNQTIERDWSDKGVVREYDAGFRGTQFVIRLAGAEYGELGLIIKYIGGPYDPANLTVNINAKTGQLLGSYEWTAHVEKGAFTLSPDAHRTFRGKRLNVTANGETVAFVDL